MNKRKILLSVFSLFILNTILFKNSMSMSLDETSSEDLGLELKLAVEKGKFYKIADLIDKGADINHLFEDGFNPLMCAVLQKNFLLVETLINLGANLNIENNQRFNAIMLAAYSGEVEIIERLLIHKANLFNSEGKSFIEFINNTDIKEIISKLIIKQHIKDNNLLACLTRDVSNIVFEYI